MHRTALALAAAGAVAATAITTAVLTGPDGASREVLTSADTTPSPTTPSRTSSATPSPSGAAFTPARDHAWRTSIPADLDVATGLPAAGGDHTRDSDPVTWTFCETEAFPEGDAVSALREGADGPEYADHRDLRVFPDDTDAHRFLSHARDAATACPEEQHGATRWLHTVSSGSAGDESVRILQTYETDGLTNAGATWWDLTRVGNAVLLTTTGGEYLPGETLGQGIRDHQELVAPIVASLCAFSVEPCSAAAPGIPADFPLAAGWPADSRAEPGPRYGLTGPNDTLPPVELSSCGIGVAVTGGIAVLRADWSNVEDHRSRTLLRFADEDEAAGFLTDLTRTWSDCPGSPSGGHYVTVHDTRATTLGDDSTALVSWAEYDGSPAIGAEVVHVVRVGASVLVDTSANEGSRTGIDDQVAAQGGALTAVLDALSR